MEDGGVCIKPLGSNVAELLRNFIKDPAEESHRGQCVCLVHQRHQSAATLRRLKSRAEDSLGGLSRHLQCVGNGLGIQKIRLLSRRKQTLGVFSEDNKIDFPLVVALKG